MKLIITIAALLGTAVAANAASGMLMKQCTIETLTDTIVANTPWIEELTADDPTARTMLLAGFLEGMNTEMTDEDWQALSEEDTSPLRKEPAALLMARWAFDAMASCNQTPS